MVGEAENISSIMEMKQASVGVICQRRKRNLCKSIQPVGMCGWEGGGWVLHIGLLNLGDGEVTPIFSNIMYFISLLYFLSIYHQQGPIYN